MEAVVSWTRQNLDPSLIKFRNVLDPKLDSLFALVECSEDLLKFGEVSLSIFNAVVQCQHKSARTATSKIPAISCHLSQILHQLTNYFLIEEKNLQLSDVNNFFSLNFYYCNLKPRPIGASKWADFFIFFKTN